MNCILPARAGRGSGTALRFFYIAVPGYMFVVIVAYISLHLLTLLHNIYWKHIWW